MPSGRGSLRRRGSPDLDNSPYNSQSLAAGGSALLDAINRGKVHLAKFILDAGECDVANTKDFKGKTPLIRACYIREQSTRDRAVRLLISKGADVNLQCDIGRTALSYACEMRCNDVVRILVKNNVDPDIPDDLGNTPLMYSAIVGNDSAIHILIRSFRRLGLQVDHVNNEGYTALLLAAKHGNIACASMLALDGRACIAFRDRDRGMNAEEWAREHGCCTPEVMPFSCNALVYQQKFGRFIFPHKLEDEEEYNSGNRNACGQALKQPGSKDNSFDLDTDEREQAEAKLRSKLKELNFNDRKLVKRGSLPAIKLCSGMPKRPPLDRPKTLTTEPDSVSPGQLTLTTKSVNKHKATGSSDSGHEASKSGPSPTSVSAVSINLATNGPVGKKQ